METKLNPEICKKQFYGSSAATLFSIAMAGLCYLFASKGTDKNIIIGLYLIATICFLISSFSLFFKHKKSTKEQREFVEDFTKFFDKTKGEKK